MLRDIVLGTVFQDFVILTCSFQDFVIFHSWLTCHIDCLDLLISLP